MEHLYKRKPNLLFFWFLLPFLLDTGYAVGKLEGVEISISNLQEMTLYSLTHPWPFKVTTLTVKAVLILLLIWGFGIIWYVGNYRSLIPGLEYGSAKFADIRQVNEKLEDTDDSMNKILSQNIRMSINTRKTGLNNNVTVIGGSGKSFHYAGGAVLTKLPVCGYYEEELFTELTQEQADDLFISLNRVTPAMQSLL